MTISRHKLPEGFVYLDELDLSQSKFPELYADIANEFGASNESKKLFSSQSESQFHGPRVDIDIHFEEFMANSDKEFDEMIMGKFRQDQHVCRFIDPGVGHERWCCVDGCRNTISRF